MSDDAGGKGRDIDRMLGHPLVAQAIDDEGLEAIGPRGKMESGQRYHYAGALREGPILKVLITLMPDVVKITYQASTGAKVEVGAYGDRTVVMLTDMRLPETYITGLLGDRLSSIIALPGGDDLVITSAGMEEDRDGGMFLSLTVD